MENTGGWNSPRPQYRPSNQPANVSSAWAGFVQERPDAPYHPPSSPNIIKERPAWGAGVTNEIDAQHAGLLAKRAQSFTQNRSLVNSNPSMINKIAFEKNPAAAYQKEAAIRAAESAIRPWQPMGAGMGEREGALLAQQGPGYLSLASPNLKTSPAAAEAIGRAAARVARPGTAQVGALDAWSPVPHAIGREIWPADIVHLPPRYCTGCRGGHEPEHERNSSWEPYSPLDRLRNLNMLETKFSVALSKGSLCAKLNSDSLSKPVIWTWSMKDEQGEDSPVTPELMGKEDFISQLVLMYEGLREGHEPFRHLATNAAMAFLSTQSQFIVDSVERLMKPINLALSTYEPHLVGHMLTMIQGLLKSHPGVGPAFRPHLDKILPYLALFRPRNFTLHLPPPFCLPSSGSFTGNGVPPKSGARTCGVCGCPVDKDLKALKEKQKMEEQRNLNAHLMDEPVSQHKSRNPLNGRKSKKHQLSSLISSTLDLIVSLCGPGTLSAVQRIIPRYCYYDPQ